MGYVIIKTNETCVIIKINERILINPTRKILSLGIANLKYLRIEM